MQRKSLRFTVSRTAFVALSAWAALSAAPAHAFSDDEARKAILELRGSLNNTNAQLSAAQRAVVDLQNRLDQANQQIATVRGRNDELNNQLTQLQRAQKDYYTDLDSRLKKFEPQQETVDGVQGTVQPGEGDSFNAALKKFQGGDYRAAATGFDAFVKQFPDSPNKPNALFWLGNAYYGVGEYAKSNAAFKSLVDAFPQHPRAPQALLGIAQNQAEQKQTKAARETLTRVTSQYAGTPAAQDAQTRLSKLR